LGQFGTVRHMVFFDSLASPDDLAWASADARGAWISGDRWFAGNLRSASPRFVGPCRKWTWPGRFFRRCGPRRPPEGGGNYPWDAWSSRTTPSRWSGRRARRACLRTGKDRTWSLPLVSIDVARNAQLGLLRQLMGPEPRPDRLDLLRLPARW